MAPPIPPRGSLGAPACCTCSPWVPVGLLAGWGGWRDGQGLPEARRTSRWSCFSLPHQTLGSDHLPPDLASWPLIPTQNPTGLARRAWRQGPGRQTLPAPGILPAPPAQPAPARPPRSRACVTPAPACRFTLGGDPSPLSPPPLHAARSPPLPDLPSVSSPCLVRNLFASEAISPCFVYTTALVAFGFCYCRETQILYTLCKIYAKPQLSISYSPCGPCTVARY